MSSRPLHAQILAHVPLKPTTVSPLIFRPDQLLACGWPWPTVIPPMLFKHTATMSDFCRPFFDHQMASEKGPCCSEFFGCPSNELNVFHCLSNSATICPFTGNSAAFDWSKVVDFSYHHQLTNNWSANDKICCWPKAKLNQSSSVKHQTYGFKRKYVSRWNERLPMFSDPHAVAPYHSQHQQNGCLCLICGKAFSRHWLLQGHMRTHTGEKPFRCPICSKAFADKSNLRAHTQTHSGVKPFVCMRCGKAFALKSYLSKHEESACVKSVPLKFMAAFNKGKLAEKH